MAAYRTKQRDAVIEVLMQNKDKHITVDEIVSKLETRGNGVGRTTVYRCLEILENEGKVRKYLAGGKESSCYQYVEEKHVCNEHFHLKCEKCGKLFHIQCEHLNTLAEHIDEEHGFKVNELKTVLYGLCEGCSK